MQVVTHRDTDYRPSKATAKRAGLEKNSKISNSVSFGDVFNSRAMLFDMEQAR